jgi:hypothetical protein
VRAARLLWPLLALPALAFAGAGEESGGTLALGADQRETGHIRLVLTAPPGVAVTIEDSGRPLNTVTPTASQTVLRRAAPWRCDLRDRVFTARSAGGRTATARLRTPSCAKRLRLTAPRRARTGREVRLALVDRWRLGGFRTRLCVIPPGGGERAVAPNWSGPWRGPPWGQTVVAGVRYRATPNGAISRCELPPRCARARRSRAVPFPPSRRRRAAGGRTRCRAERPAPPPGRACGR